ncbi:group 1 glycosyl transferase [Calothrix sp. NIES-4071]|nr:group 1 glycosyl transferase [Calothrix sp. NIES-4071]BAZ63316.1 group 1 glycosyl transferase [Calothrix sp. NIES-4105]
MKFQNILVTGEELFFERHKFLLTAMSQHIEKLQLLPRRLEWYESNPRLRQLIKAMYTIRTGSLNKANSVFQKNKQAFTIKSQHLEEDIKNLGYTPDFIFHFFCTFRPFWNPSDIPYSMYLDYTMALAEQNWAPWSWFLNDKERQGWRECEKESYERAYHIFTMGNVVKNSLIKDYGITPEKITVIGSSGDFIETYTGDKQFGSQQILFNGSDFERKGGDLVIDAFRQVRKKIKNAKLILIGTSLSINEDGIENLGFISSRSEIHKLFLNSDLVVAPAYCDPFPTFVMEAMNYGTPCIVSANDGMPDIVDNQVNGIVIQQQSADELANSIISLLNDPMRLKCMSQEARLKVKTKLNWNNIAVEITKALSSESPVLMTLK